jgi:hypothetical protein
MLAREDKHIASRNEHCLETCPKGYLALSDHCGVISFFSVGWVIINNEPNLKYTLRDGFVIEKK